MIMVTSLVGGNKFGGGGGGRFGGGGGGGGGGNRGGGRGGRGGGGYGGRGGGGDRRGGGKTTLLPFPICRPILTHLQQTTLENTVTKG